MALKGEEISIIGEFGQEDLVSKATNQQLGHLIASLVLKHYQFGIQLNNLQMSKIVTMDHLSF